MATVYDAQAEVAAAEGAWGRRDLVATSVRLDAFWKAKAAAWTSDPATQRSLTLLDAQAHSIWARMEDAKALAADTGSAERAEHARIAAGAWQKVAELKAMAGSSAAVVSTYQKLAASSAAAPQWMNQQIVDASYGAAVRQQAGNVAQTIFGGDLLGVPVWAWAAGGALLLIAIVRR